MQTSALYTRVQIDFVKRLLTFDLMDTESFIYGIIFF